jgi:hypothetical protein
MERTGPQGRHPLEVGSMGRRGRRTGGALLCLVLASLGTAACQASSERAEKQAQKQAPTQTASPTARVPVPTSSRSGPTSQPPSGTARPAPSITVPTSLQRPGRDRQVLGADVSWPQCPKGMGIPEKRSLGAPMPDATARFVVVGLTNGPGFTPNPCLADQVRWVRTRHLMAAAYAVASFPDRRTLATAGPRGPFDAGTRLGRLSNVGYQQARYNVANLERAGLRTPIIWIDVEPVPRFDWSTDLTANAAVVRGAARGYTDAGFEIGAYSTQSLWQRVVGDLVLAVPEWRAAGQTSRAEALRRCGPDRMFQGGLAVLSQWVEAGRDRNVTCPGTSAQLSAWFHQY